MKIVKLISVLFLGAILLVGSCQLTTDKRSTEETFTLWQLTNQTPTQMMSYVILTTHRKVLVIDGGNMGDAPYLRYFIRNLGNSVEAWFISHPHFDHLSALKEILKNTDGMKIKAIQVAHLWDYPHAGTRRIAKTNPQVTTCG